MINICHRPPFLSPPPCCAILIVGEYCFPRVLLGARRQRQGSSLMRCPLRTLRAASVPAAERGHDVFARQISTLRKMICHFWTGVVKPTDMVAMKLAAIALPLASALPSATVSGNMNGKYAVSSGGDIGVPWNDDYKSKVGIPSPESTNLFFSPESAVRRVEGGSAGVAR
jgi:hypothetical protein